MFDKYGFYFTKQVGFQKYDLDIWASTTLELENNEYVVFHKRRFFKKNTNQLQKSMALVCKKNDEFKFNFNKDFFKYGLTYYQRNGKNAMIKWWTLEQLELFQPLFNSFDLDIKLRENLEIHWNYPNIEQISNLMENASIDEAISFLLALAVVHGEWNLVDEVDDAYLWNILIKFPFDSVLGEYMNLIFSLEDKLLKNWFYNKLVFTKKQHFIFNIYDVDLLKILGESVILPWINTFFQIDEKLVPLYIKKEKDLKKQLDIDLRIKLDSFKLVEIEWITFKF